MEAIQAVEWWAQALAFTKTERCDWALGQLRKTDLSRGFEAQATAALRHHMAHSAPYFVGPDICERCLVARERLAAPCHHRPASGVAA